MLKEIQEGTNIEVRVLVVHPTELPPEIRPGLSPAVTAAVPEMCRRIMNIVSRTDLAEPIQEGETQ